LSSLKMIELVEFSTSRPVQVILQQAAQVTLQVHLSAATRVLGTWVLHHA